jgi:poly(A) polymerase Pap1
MLARMVINTVDQRYQSAHALLRAFFEEYGEWNWAEHTVSISGEGSDTTFYKRAAREPMAVLTNHKPVINVAAAASLPTVAVVQKEFARARTMLTQGTSWASICMNQEETARQFLEQYDKFVIVDLNYWGVGPSRLRALAGFLESRLVRVSYGFAGAEYVAYASATAASCFAFKRSCSSSLAWPLHV